jgi:hypothetical protein
VYVGIDARIGDDTLLSANVSVMDRCLIGARVGDVEHRPAAGDRQQRLPARRHRHRQVRTSTA